MATPIPPNEARFRADELRATVQGSWLGAAAPPNAELCGVSTDSRALGPSQVFVALRGERFDGHDHLAQAQLAGAALALVEREIAAPAGLPTLRVASTLQALAALARHHVRRWRARATERRVLAVTGSAGKTTTRQAMAALLRAVAPERVLASEGNLNNLIGVPMMALRLGEEHCYGVFELGTSHPGEIRALAETVEPDLGVVTLIAGAHGEGLGSVEEIAAEKSSLWSALRSDGIAIGNGDDVRVAAALAGCEALRRLRYGFGAGLEYRIVDRRPDGIRGATLALTRSDGSELVFRVPLLGRAGALAAAAAVAACESLTAKSCAAEAVSQAFEALRSEADNGRLRPQSLASGLIVIDDTYNANPASCSSSLAAAAEIAQALGRPLVLVLGEMRELGADAPAAHQAIGREAAGLGARHLIAVSGLAELLAVAARDAGLSTEFASDAAAAASLAVARVQADDVVLIKGSRGVRTELIAQALRQAHGSGVAAAARAALEPEASRQGAAR